MTPPQSPQVPVPYPPPGPPNSQYQTDYNAAYYKSQRPEKQPFYYNRPGGLVVPFTEELNQDQRWNLCDKLNSLGIIFDEEIDAQAQDPYSTNYSRIIIYGNSWEPKGTGRAISNEVIMLGMYTGPVPPGQIMISLNINDYPSWKTSAPTPIPTPVVIKNPNPIGILILLKSTPHSVGSLFRETLSDGYNVTDTWTGTITSLGKSFTGTWTKSALFAGLLTCWEKTA